MKMLKRDVLAFGILFAFCCLLAAVDAEAVVTSYTPADVTIAYSQFAYDEKPCGNDTVNYAAVGTAVTPSLIFQGTCGNSSNSVWYNSSRIYIRFVNLTAGCTQASLRITGGGSGALGINGSWMATTLWRGDENYGFPSWNRTLLTWMNQPFACQYGACYTDNSWGVGYPRLDGKKDTVVTYILYNLSRDGLMCNTGETGGNLTLLIYENTTNMSMARIFNPWNNITLSVDGELTGDLSVIVRVNGELAGGELVKVTSAAGLNWSMATGSEGVATFYTLPYGTYTVRVIHDALQTQTRMVTLAEPARTEYFFFMCTACHLGALGSIGGYIKDQNSAGLASAFIITMGYDSNGTCPVSAPCYTVSDVNGLYNQTGLTHGFYAVSFTYGGSTGIAPYVYVDGDEALNRWFTTSGARAINASVHDTGGKAVSGVFVSAIACGTVLEEAECYNMYKDGWAEVYASGTTDASGLAFLPLSSAAAGVSNFLVIAEKGGVAAYARVEGLGAYEQRWAFLTLPVSGGYGLKFKVINATSGAVLGNVIISAQVGQLLNPDYPIYGNTSAAGWANFTVPDRITSVNWTAFRAGCSQQSGYEANLLGALQDPYLIGIQMGCAAGAKYANVTGYLTVDGTSTPVDMATMGLQCAGASLRSVKTADDGRYAFWDVAQTSYCRLYVIKADYYNISNSSTAITPLNESKSINLTVFPLDTGDYVTAVLTVYDEDTKQPLANADAYMRYVGVNSAWIHRKTDSQGEASFYILRGAVKYKAEAGGHITSPEYSAILLPGQSFEANIWLKPSIAAQEYLLRGRCYLRRTEGDQGIPCTIRAYRGGYPAGNPFSSDSLGYFSKALAGGNYTVKAAMIGGKSSDEEETVELDHNMDYSELNFYFSDMISRWYDFVMDFLDFLLEVGPIMKIIAIFLIFAVLMALLGVIGGGVGGGVLYAAGGRRR